MYMNDFVAIDFETANQHRTSVCSVGIVIVRNGQVTDSVYKLIKPTPNYYSWFCTEVHGMVFQDTADAQTFPDVWAAIAPLICDLPLVAHNSPFDEGCLRAVHEFYEMTYPEYEFYDTLRASRQRFGGILPNHQLHTVSAHVGFDLDNHHHALADAEACAAIAIKIL